MDSDIKVGDIVQIFNDCCCPMCKTHDTGVVISVAEREVKIKFMGKLLTDCVDTLCIDDLRVIGRVADE